MIADGILSTQAITPASDDPWNSDSRPIGNFRIRAADDGGRFL
jgi:hypothetical protein